jgi:nucleoid-associated protein Lsr2
MATAVLRSLRATAAVDFTKNRAKWDKAFGPYVEHARRMTVRRQRRLGASTGTGHRVDRAAVRTWAKGQGLKVSERGRISAALMARYETAH